MAIRKLTETSATVVHGSVIVGMDWGDEDHNSVVFALMPGDGTVVMVGELRGIEAREWIKRELKDT